ncbi:hypothetical protein BC941DRAFT_428657 [Chlamydoabsidia padenii]|nr:hypothetical protein BC941DRAFT_428657 [Chlamydoabsidia padenii]
MTSIVSSVMSHADKIPIVGPMASGWLPSLTMNTNNKKTQSFITPYPPPSYCDATGLHSPSKLSKLSDYVWRQGIQLLPDMSLSNAMTIDKKQMEQVTALIHLANEMGQSGNHQMANDLYIMSIDRMLFALPLESDPTLKFAMEYRLSEFKKRRHLNLDQPFEEMMMSIANCQELMDDGGHYSTKPSSLSSRLTLANMLSSVACLGVDVYKRSPIPDVMSYSVSCFLAGLTAVDSSCQLRQRSWNLAVQGVAKAMELDRQYELHRLLADKLLLTCNALLQAALAQSEHTK